MKVFCWKHVRKLSFNLTSALQLREEYTFIFQRNVISTHVAENFLLNLIIPDFHKINYKFEHKYLPTNVLPSICVYVNLTTICIKGKEHFRCIYAKG